LWDISWSPVETEFIFVHRKIEFYNIYLCENGKPGSGYYGPELKFAGWQRSWQPQKDEEKDEEDNADDNEVDENEENDKGEDKEVDENE
jgi:hypothetical protein